MPVILGRRHNAGTAEGAVHAFELDLDGEPPAELHAPCGHTLTVDEIEQVEQFTGAPCVACLMLAFGHAEPAASAEHTHTLANAEDLPGAETPVVPVDQEPESGYLYGIALRGDQTTHLVEPGAIRSRLDNRSVVLTACGVLAWGPVSMSTGWPLCDDCGACRT